MARRKNEVEEVKVKGTKGVKGKGVKGVKSVFSEFDEIDESNESDESESYESEKEVKAKKGKDAEPKGRVKPITLKPLKVAETSITLQGMSPLLVNNFDIKTQKELDDIHQEGLNAKERKIRRDDKTRERKTPEEEYEASLYTIRKGVYGIPAAGIKKCAVTAATLSNVPSTVAMKAFHVLDDACGLVEIKGKPVMDERMVRVGPFGNKKPATRRRGRFDKWECTFRVRYREDLITPLQLANLYESAGFSVGLCEYRPEKSGNQGMFCVKVQSGRR